MGKRKRMQRNLPPGVKYYEDLSDVPWDLQKYWHQRYSIFSRFDEGIWMTDDAWFGVTPEPVATRVAEHIANSVPKQKCVMIDAFAGVGGNAIAFARSGKWRRVYAIEKDPATLKCAQHNAELYGVQDRITWFEGDCFEIIPEKLKSLADYCVLFASPPWGGPGYRSDEVFNLSTMQPYSLNALHELFSKITSHMVLYLPRTSDLRQIAGVTHDRNKVEKVVVVHYCMEGASKALCAFIGSFTWEQETKDSVALSVGVEPRT